MTITRILVATDFTRGADLAAASAFWLARALGASIHLLHVVDDPLLGMGWTDDYAYDMPRLRESLVKDAERLLAKIAAAQDRVHVTTEVAVGRPAETIVQAAANTGTDLIVVGTHGRTGLGRMVMGSVAERVVRHAGCAVLTIRETALPDEAGVIAAGRVPATVAG